MALETSQEEDPLNHKPKCRQHKVVHTVDILAFHSSWVNKVTQALVHVLSEERDERSLSNKIAKAKYYYYLYYGTNKSIHSAVCINESSFVW
jgi:hypothetical protein